MNTNSFTFYEDQEGNYRITPKGNIDNTISIANTYDDAVFITNTLNGAYPKYTKGISLITLERLKQITKHGFTAEHHANHSEWYEKNQLLYAARFLLTGGIEDIDKQLIEAPIGWNKDWFYDLTQRSEDERLVIAGALIAAEIDRREYLKKHSK